MEIISVEDQIIRGTIEALLFRGYYLGVNDGEETTVHHTREMHKILEAMKTTDEDYLLVYKSPLWKAERRKHIGWVYFVYGNEDYEVINDYTVNLESVMVDVNGAIEKYQDTL